MLPKKKYYSARAKSKIKITVNNKFKNSSSFSFVPLSKLLNK